MGDDQVTGEPVAPGQQAPHQPEELLDVARVELDSTASQLEQLTAELNECAEHAARLELITNVLLEVMTRAAVVVDANKRVVAVSRVAASEYPSLTHGLGKMATRALPDELARALVGFEEQGGDGNAHHHEDHDAVYSSVSLSDGSVLLLLRTSSRI